MKKNGESIKKTTEIKIKNGTFINYFPPMSKSRKRALSMRQSLHNTGGKCKWFTVGNTKVQGTYEKIFAEALENQSIEWIKPKLNSDLFRYYDKFGNEKHYTPDFYLKELDIYIEIKGYWWGDDENKMKLVKEQHKDKKLVVIFGLKKLNEICENIKERILLEPLWSW